MSKAALFGAGTGMALNILVFHASLGATLFGLAVALAFARLCYVKGWFK